MRTLHLCFITVNLLILSGCGIDLAQKPQSSGSGTTGIIETQMACDTLTNTQPSIDRLTRLAQCYADFTQSIASKIELESERVQLDRIQRSLADLKSQTSSIQRLYCGLSEQCIVEVERGNAIYNDYLDIANRIRDMNTTEGEPKQLSRVIKEIGEKVRGNVAVLQTQDTKTSQAWLASIEACNMIATRP